MLPEGADALWRLTVTTERDRLDVTFPPAFVHAGSARVRVLAAGGNDTAYGRVADDGYIAEWRALSELLASGMPVEYDELLDDVRYPSVSRTKPRPSSERSHERPDRRSLVARVLPRRGRRASGQHSDRR